MTDAERAADIRAKIKPHLEAIAVILNEATKDGFSVSYSMAPDPTGAVVAPVPAVTKQVKL